MSQPVKLSYQNLRAAVTSAVAEAKQKHVPFQAAEQNGIVVDSIRITGIVFASHSLPQSPSLVQTEQFAAEVASGLKQRASSFLEKAAVADAAFTPATLVSNGRVLLGYSPYDAVVALID